MSNYFCMLVIGVLMVGCKKDVPNFTPTTEVKNIFKNEKLAKVYYDFRKESVYLSASIDTAKSFKTFVATASINELIALTECERPIVRCLAFKALLAKNYPQIRKIVVRHKYDDAEVEEFRSQCIRMSIPVKNYMLDHSQPFGSFKDKEFLALEKEILAN